MSIMEDEEYAKNLEKYGVLFCFRIIEDTQHIITLGDKFSELDRSMDFTNRLDDLGMGVIKSLTEAGLDPSPEIVAAAYRSDPTFKVNMMFAMSLSKLLHDNEMRVLNLFEFISLRSLCVELSINSDCSVQSRMISCLGIPVQNMPPESVSVSRTLDEYIKAVNLIESKLSVLMPPDSFSSCDSYRDYMKSVAGDIIKEVNDAGFYGTYPEYVFVEMAMLRKLSPDQYPSLYGTSMLPRWDVAYDELKQIVLNAWRIRNGGD